ncbi:LysR family transcriptional regulator [Parasedimentitalea huanghaiensis]|uniref:LysR family transcriptional regulator n=1 Tax=Parasedimentitalea huanghaiensis TaxID=2682100 RepID=A0A6L6WMY1_9RHOB|nr:LysR family transcriptional regulator [Zongyanglinia huanghaiensis]MVO17955.1 LysR family transcriptional regulator [Zongyanglinia huanghaiensis]
MNLQQLTVFREIMRSGSISQAARNLHRTQPAISASLKTLEADLNMPLFLREGRRLVPVPEAHYLLSEASDVLDRLKTAEQNMTALRDRTEGTLRIVAMPGPSSYLLPEFISRFIADTPGVDVSLSTRSSPQVRNLVAAQQYDIGFCDSTGATDKESLFLNEEIFCNCVCALSASHPLAARNVITTTDLDGAPMGALQSSHSTYQKTQKAFDSTGANFKVRVDAQYFLPLYNFVEAGQICAIVDVLSAVSYLHSNSPASGIKFLPFKPDIPFGYSILTPRQRPMSYLAEEFVNQWRYWVKVQLKGWERPKGDT